MFLTPEQTGGPLVFALRRHNHYLAVRFRVSGDEYLTTSVHPFNIEQLAQALRQPAGETWQGHVQVILLACMDGKLFEWLDKIGGEL